MIKEQCEQCKRNNIDCQENIEFNGLSCEQYVKRINLEKSEKMRFKIITLYSKIKIHLLL